MSKFNVRILIEAIDNATGPIRRIARSLKELSNTQGIQNLKTAFGGLKGAMGNVAAQAGLLTAKLGAAAAVGGLAFKKLVFDQMVSWENLEQSLKGLLGGSKQAKNAMAWIADFAKRTPMDVQGVAESFRMMTALGLKPMQGQMEAIVDTASALGGSQESMRRIALALGQAWTKQKLQGQEILQLTEAGVSVWDLLAKATGKNTLELQKLSEAGKLGRKEIQLLIDAMGKKYKGAAVGMANTTAGIISNLKDAWQRFTLILYEEGLLDFFKAELKGLLDQVDAMAQSGQLKQFAIEFKNNVITLFRELKTVAVQVWPVIKGLAQGFAALAQAVGGYGNLLKIVIGLMALPLVASLIQAGVALFNFGKAAYTAIQGAKWLGTAFTAVRTAIVAIGAGLGGTVGIVIAAVAAIAAAAFLIIQNWGPIKAWFINMWNEWGGVIRLLSPPINAIVMLAGAIKSAWASVGPFFTQLFNTIRTAAASAARAFQPLINAAHQVRSAISGAMAAAKSGVGTAVQNFKGFANQATGHVPRRAVGGSVRKGLPYQVGEFGREFFVPGADGRIVPHNALSRLQGAIDSRLNIHIRIDSEGRPRLADLKQQGSNHNISLDMGLINSYG
ncbi:tape measure protein [Vampirovibrio chlorellavorus]|uniref:tape measure protein n=1 Tax=Vampirovibrio chlorellavorus TaxID=758823 RepID=UPI0026F26380|nr:tape measure protein [Vampirovibrio chlorellavorus]